MTTTQAQKAARFLELHRPGSPLLMPNPWDIGSAVLLASLGFEALATTSGGYAATLGRLDGGVSREEALAGAAAIAGAVDVPVSADLEDCFADDPAGVAETVGLAIGAGLSGCSVEDFTRRPEPHLFSKEAAAERVAAAAERAHAGPVRFVITARAENHLRGNPDLGDTIARLQAYQEAGADVLFAPGINGPDDLRTLIAAVDRPVNVLPQASAPPVAELAGLGAARISVGGAFAYAALGAVVEAARELRGEGTYGYLARTALGRDVASPAFR